MMEVHCGQGIQAPVWPAPEERRSVAAEQRIYLMDEDASFSQVLAYCLEQEGWQVTCWEAERPERGREAARPDLWVLDGDSPAGFHLMREIRRRDAAVPILLTLAKERVLDRVVGLELGCRDMVLKPFSPKELVLRIRRIFADAAPEEERTAERVLQNYRLRYGERTAVGPQGAVYLTNKEFSLLDCFARHKGMALSREQILHHVWGDGYFGSDRVVDDLVRRTRKKLTGLRVQTLYGYGYRVHA